MALQFVQFLATTLKAVALVPGGAHLASLANKMTMARAAYFVTQQIYAGWAFFGIVLFGALGANLVLTIMLRRLGRSFDCALAAALFIAANLVIFFIWTFPTNQAASNWTLRPRTGMSCASGGEYSRAVNAVVMFMALVCVVVVVLQQRSARG
jgi:hypothetical protein